MSEQLPGFRYKKEEDGDLRGIVQALGRKKDQSQSKIIKYFVKFAVDTLFRHGELKGLAECIAEEQNISVDKCIDRILSGEISIKTSYVNIWLKKEKNLIL